MSKGFEETCLQRYVNGQYARRKMIHTLVIRETEIKTAKRLKFYTN